MSAAERNRGYGRTVSRASTQAPPALPDVRKEPIRVTLDLRPMFHKKLKRWCNTAALEQDLSRVDLSAVLRVLADELLEDDRLAEKVARRLKEGDGQL